MSIANLRDLPGLRAREPLGEQIVIRVTRADRQQLEQAATELGVPAGRLVRVILRHVLSEAAALKAPPSPGREP